MKKLIIKTALITFVSAIVFAAALFGILSLFAPAAMMRFTASLGFRQLSGDYAYSVYTSTGDIEYLAYSCETAAESVQNVTAERYALLIEHDGFSAYCQQKDAEVAGSEYAEYVLSDYAQYSYGKYACALLRQGNGEGAIDFALSHLNGEFGQNNCVTALAMEGIRTQNEPFCQNLAARLKASEFAENENCKEIISVLEEFSI